MEENVKKFFYIPLSLILFIFIYNCFADDFTPISQFGDENEEKKLKAKKLQ